MANNNEVAIKQRDVTSTILSRVEEMKQEGLALPKNYNPSNALQSAFLKIQDMEVRGTPVLEIVTRKSVVESLLNMVLQGLSPAKNQVYFIPYDNQLQMQRSYFGTQAVLKRLDGVKNIWAEVIREEEPFEFRNIDGRKRLVEHEQRFETLDNDIVGAYAIIDTEEEGKILEVMTKKQIQASWSQAKTTKVHNKFGDQMAMRTVINRAAKNYINTSDDSDLLIHAINDTTENEYDDEQRRKDVTEAPKEEKTENLLEEFKKTQPKEEEPAPAPEPEEVEEVEEVLETEEAADEVEDDVFPFGQDELVRDAEYEEVEEAREASGLDWSQYTIEQIKEFLDNAGVEYESSARKPELIDLAEATLNGGIQDELF